MSEGSVAWHSIGQELVVQSNAFLGVYAWLQSMTSFLAVALLASIHLLLGHRFYFESSSTLLALTVGGTATIYGVLN